MRDLVRRKGKESKEDRQNGCHSGCPDGPIPCKRAVELVLSEYGINSTVAGKPLPQNTYKSVALNHEGAGNRFLA